MTTPVRTAFDEPPEVDPRWMDELRTAVGENILYALVRDEVLMIWLNSRLEKDFGPGVVPSPSAKLARLAQARMLEESGVLEPRPNSKFSLPSRIRLLERRRQEESPGDGGLPPAGKAMEVFDE